MGLTYPSYNPSWFKVQKKKRVVVFDGVCFFCNKCIDILMKLDKNKTLKYTSLQGAFMKTLNVEQDLQSIILYEDGALYYKSTAILRILRSLGGIWILTNIFYLIPKVIRDYIYDLIAKHRYRIFGKMEHCRMPKKDEQDLFID
ncbi:thiol-disulfide oxidoreductase DCC family protein [Sulfurovum sp. AR]|uniref:thiol-disulfide oxidoreductase DCC family protein n=1 Tax=Sulfurovum sp. AR TaxID=1165841 RepID=UPI00025C4C8F|nr:DCC1-like thiol-disulfide oxidoreductase family protein [Sulfurovum sp. AR]EIF52003.1 thiol-disulfide oxidoreductase dcc [Sulfurovum sp. AR]